MPTNENKIVRRSREAIRNRFYIKHHISNIKHSSLGLVVLSHRDDHFPSSMPLFEISESFSDLTQRIRPVDDRRHLSGLHQIAQNIQIVFGQFRNVEDELLAGEI